MSEPGRRMDDDLDVALVLGRKSAAMMAVTGIRPGCSTPAQLHRRAGTGLLGAQHTDRFDETLRRMTVRSFTEPGFMTPKSKNSGIRRIPRRIVAVPPWGHRHRRRRCGAVDALEAVVARWARARHPLRCCQAIDDRQQQHCGDDQCAQRRPRKTSTSCVLIDFHAFSVSLTRR